jgi:hypothetical protein
MNIKKQEDLDSILASVDWHHAFVRELHLVSPSYYLPEKRHTVAPDGKPDAFILICTGDPLCRHVELVFHEVERLSVLCNIDLNPFGVIQKDRVELVLSPIEKAGTVARSIDIRRLGDEGSGWDLRYGISNPFSKSGVRDD